MWPILPRSWSPALRAVGLVLLAFVIATWAWWPMIDGSPKTPDLDGRYVFHQIEIGKAAWQQYREIALWNPYDCRGIPMWDHPEAMTASPILLLLTPLSGIDTLILWNVIHCAAGFVSMWLLARREVGLSRTTAFVAAAMWSCSAAHISQYAGAHSTLVDFWLAPLLVLLWRRAEHDFRYAIGFGATLAFMVYDGATYPLPYAVLIVALETLSRVWPLKRLIPIVRAGAIAGVVAIGLAAARLLPLADQLMQRKRENMSPDIDSLLHFYSLKQMYIWREGHWWNRLPEQQYVWAEYLAYIGVLAVLIAAIGAFVALREQRWLVTIAAATLVMMLGHFSAWAPWEVLQGHIFPFKAMRVPSRFRLVMQLSIALWVALAIERVPKLAERWLGVKTSISSGMRALLLGMALLSAGDALGLGKDIIEWMHQGAPAHTVDRAAHFYYEGPNLAEFIDQPRQNRAWLGCRSYEWPSNSEAPLWTGDLPQAKAEDENAARVLSVVRTVNTFRIDVDAKQPTLLLLNSGFGTGWRSNAGNVIEKSTGPNDKTKMLALEIPAGHRIIKVRYWPRLLTIGIRISIATAIAIVLAWGLRDPVRRWRARRQR
jgi:hypothetical protein